MWEFQSQVSNIEQQSQGRELSSIDMCVFIKPHNRGVIDQRLVEVLEEVAEPHQRDNHPVDLADQPLFLLWGELDDGFAAEKGEGCIAIFGYVDTGFERRG